MHAIFTPAQAMNVLADRFAGSAARIASGVTWQDETGSMRTEPVPPDGSPWGGPAFVNHFTTMGTTTTETDLPREFASHVVMESAYSAAAVTIRTMDELTGSLLNVKV